MDTIFSEKLISLRELALLCFALLLLAATPDTSTIAETPHQQPVNIVIPEEEKTAARINAA